jgi:hypothetical protein
MIKFTKEFLKRSYNKINIAAKTTFKKVFFFTPVNRYLKNMSRPLYLSLILVNFGVYGLWKIP